MPPIIYSKYSSDELWELCIGDDHNAFKALFDREFQAMFHFGLKISQSQSDVKDALQEVFTDLWIKKSNRNIKHIKIYLLKSLKYRLIKIKPSGKIVDINVLSNDQLSCSTDFYENDSKLFQLKAVLSQLPKNQQEILHLKYYQGLSNAQIAEVLDINYQSVSNRLHRVLCSFRKKIQKKISI